MPDAKKKIVLVDDELSFLNLFGDLLEQNGFEVVKFFNPREAMAKIPEEKPDLILLDIAMPEVTGLNVFEHLKNDLKDKMPKVIFLTNLNETMGGVKLDQNFAESLGAHGYLRKTDDLKDLMGTIQEKLK